MLRNGKKFLAGLKDGRKVYIGGLKPESVLIAGTGPTYRLLPEGDRKLCADLSSATGTYVITTSLAIHEALEALCCGEIALVSPYPNWLTSFGVAYWKAAGYRVASIARVFDDLPAPFCSDHGRHVFAGLGDDLACAHQRVDQEQPGPLLNLRRFRQLKATQPLQQRPDPNYRGLS